ncbi:hypothetical protein ELH93_22155 [Rhizobium leguminosarum]|uniref:Uncharacterized protein n=1 Tax=Rhizobium leguminosarum TaxID=384 RepID=A0ABD7PXX4_RHILE|nr:hypothetical protein [Rhizobium leguminosarum]TAW32046.1 hypothetical protein ELI19_22155 [Rhizobium leguminosarum]TAW45777.1 hypothetical protein ELI18_22125 [Rhizobium leguminosarum]TAY35157.1 hypothetical protein ELH93_22155 [Rhizobium leguminosarum]
MSKVVQELRRETIEAYVEQLIALLDLLDGDSDLEDNGDFEPSIGSTPQCIGNERCDDLELDSADDEDGGDEEPTMGWSNPGGLRVHIPEEAAQITALDYDDGPLRFDGSGKRLARIMLRQHPARRIKL